MFNTELFKESLNSLQNDMKSGLRGELNSEVESKIIDELVSIYIKMTDRYQLYVQTGSSFSAQPGISDFPESERVFRALQNLLERMELDFTQKFVLDFQHGLDKEIEIGKIKIALLDRVRRNLNHLSVA